MEKLDNEVDEDAADGFVVPDGYLSDSEVWFVASADSVQNSFEICPCQLWRGFYQMRLLINHVLFCHCFISF